MVGLGQRSNDLFPPVPAMANPVRLASNNCINLNQPEYSFEPLRGQP